MAGVCAGLARRWGLDPLLVRGLFVVVSIVSGFGLGLYGLGWLFLPHPDGRIHAQQVLRGMVSAGFVGSVLFILINGPMSGAGWRDTGTFHPFGNLVFLAFVGFGLWWLMNRHSPQKPDSLDVEGAAKTWHHVLPQPAAFTSPATDFSTTTNFAPRPVDVRRPLRGLTLTTFGVALVAAGAVLGWDRWISHLTDAGLVAVATALGIVALGVLVAGLMGRRAGGLAPVAIVLAIVAASGAAGKGTAVGPDTHDVNWTPMNASVATTGYDLGAGRAVLDLTTPGLLAGATSTSPVTIPASIGVGELVVVLPKEPSSRVDASAGLGGITNQLGAHAKDNGGAGFNQTIPNGTNPVLIVTAKVGLGHITVVPQGTEVTR